MLLLRSKFHQNENKILPAKTQNSKKATRFHGHNTRLINNTNFEVEFRRTKFLT